MEPQRGRCPGNGTARLDIRPLLTENYEGRGTRRILATGNAAHFQWIPGLEVTDWRSASI